LRVALVNETGASPWEEVKLSGNQAESGADLLFGMTEMAYRGKPGQGYLANWSRTPSGVDIFFIKRAHPRTLTVQNLFGSCKKFSVMETILYCRCFVLSVFDSRYLSSRYI
jgi:hypothetical protein